MTKIEKKEAENRNNKIYMFYTIKICMKYLQTQTVKMMKSSRVLMMMKTWKFLKIGMTFFTLKTGLRVEKTANIRAGYRFISAAVVLTHFRNLEHLLRLGFF
jgi:hypothetical protein